MKSLRKDAEQGDAEAQYVLGLRYKDGVGVPQDDAEAIKWFRLAAEQGYATTQYILGLCYKNGDGVPQDDVLAYMWFNLAGASGFEYAKTRRGTVSKKMTSEQIAEAQKLSREWKPKGQ